MPNNSRAGSLVRRQLNNDSIKTARADATNYSNTRKSDSRPDTVVKVVCTLKSTGASQTGRRPGRAGEAGSASIGVGSVSCHSVRSVFHQIHKYLSAAFTYSPQVRQLCITQLAVLRCVRFDLRIAPRNPELLGGNRRAQWVNPRL